MWTLGLMPITRHESPGPGTRLGWAFLTPLSLDIFGNNFIGKFDNVWVNQ